MSTDDRAREDQIAAEYRDTLGRCQEYLELVCRDAPPVDPAVQAILDAWRQGSDEKPWNDAGPEGQERSEEEGPHQPGESAPTAA